MRPLGRTVVLAAAAIAAVIALASDSAGPPVPAGPDTAQQPRRPVATPTPARLDHAALDRQDRPTRRQLQQQRRTQAAHALVDQLPLRAAGASVAVAGIDGDRTALRARGRDDVARQLVSQALLATGDDPGRYAVTWDTIPAGVDVVDPAPAVRAASAYALAASSYGPASSRTQQDRARRLAVGRLRRTAPVAVVDDTQIAVVARAELAELAGRRATVELDLASQRRRGGALERRRQPFTMRLRRANGRWRVEAFSVNGGTDR